MPADGPAVPKIIPAGGSSGPERAKTAAVGDAGGAWTAPPLTVSDFVRYQGASGDLNPIHHDEEFAKAAGFPTVFAVGMLQAGVMATYVTDWFGVRSVRRFGVQFREQAWPGDVLTYAGTVSAVRGNLLDLELTATRQTGGVHLKGWATVELDPSAV